jgi:hypothetical protein
MSLPAKDLHGPGAWRRIVGPGYAHLAIATLALGFATEALAEGGGPKQSETAAKAAVARGGGVVVLDFSGGTHLGTIHPAVSGVHFDVDVDKEPERTGWITAAASFLAADLDGNGKIDDGRELFGAATDAVGGGVMQSGFDALKQLDSNGDGVIDRTDPAWGKLVLWRDADLDGVTDTNELTSLALSSVTKIGVDYEKVRPLPSAGPDAYTNKVIARAKFWGPPACGSDGCATFAVRFGSIPGGGALRMVRSH